MKCRGEHTAILVVMLLLVSFAPAHSGGPVYGARAGGMGSAGSAVSEDGSAMAFNQAGLTRVRGLQMYVGGVGVLPSTVYGNKDGEAERTDSRIFLNPFLYVSDDLGLQDVVFGVGFFSPFGIKGRFWDDTGATRYASASETFYTYLINPTVAWKVTPWLSLGAGPNVQIVKTVSRKMIDQSAFLSEDAEERMNAKGHGYGYSLGILVSPLSQWSLGLSYRSKVPVGMDGSARLSGISEPNSTAFGGSAFRTDLNTKIPLPQTGTLGIGWRPSPRLTVAFDFSWEDWSRYREQEIDYIIEVPDAGFIDETVEKDWKDARTLSLGFEYTITREFSARLGYMFANNQVPEKSLSPGAPETNQQSVAAGLGWNANEDMWLDLFFMASSYRLRRVENEILSGSYRNKSLYAGIGLGYRF